MIRVIIDTQSNRLFRGIASEQAYDQRGGLCEVGSRGLVVTTNSFDPQYLRYWSETLGFDLPRFMEVGPFDPHYTLSELLLQKPELQRKLKRIVQGSQARLEFFCIEESERELASVLGIPAHCNFEVAITLARKPAFKRLFDEVGIPTPPWFSCSDWEEFVAKKRTVLKGIDSIVVKAGDGTGGLACGGMFLARNQGEIEALISQNGHLGKDFLVEELIPGAQTVSVHWEMLPKESPRIIGIFHQRGEYAYKGVSWPTSITAKTRKQILADITEKLGYQLGRMKALGFFCGDIVVDRNGRHWWVDLNPRKGAILYVYNMIQRISALHFGGAKCYFFHEHIHFSEKIDPSFSEIKGKLRNLISPQEQFVTITNPGVIPFGYVDITGVSLNSLREAKVALKKAKGRLLG